MSNDFSFEILTGSIREVNSKAGNAAKSAVNQLMTLRNWAIGYYIVEYEQDGNDRAEYGINLLKNLEKQIDEKGMNSTLFKACRQFYLTYPQIYSTVSNELKLSDIKKSPTVSNEFITEPEKLVSSLSFSHIREIMVIKDSFERFFYETECIKCNWSVRELRRQIKTNLYVRAGISRNPDKLLQQSIDNGNEFALTIKDPFTFEFLGFNAKDAVSESDLEQALVEHLQEFMLGLGEGFCFEAQQKRIIIDDKYNFIDLVLYNRLPHCNVIVELKNNEFKHEDLGQLNTYVAYYKENEMTEDDNPPVGILLCTDKGSQMVEYALSGMDNQLFVSTYMLHLPDKRQLEEFMLKEMKEMGL
ncbi:MAG: PDDEXK nuclease domain-containing protein [Lachnospiraceae bacterium]|nr:PDDEXK nuclease domain-containing protein [Lachnospiraceae bacterium]